MYVVFLDLRIVYYIQDSKVLWDMMKECWVIGHLLDEEKLLIEMLWKEM